MSDAANMFKKLAQNRQKSTPAKAETKTEPETKPQEETTPSVTAIPLEQNQPEAETEPEESNKKRGRPATGKRSDPDWIGRTYYIRKENDFDVEDELVKLKRAGINLDKSELVDFLLAAWVKWRKGENINIQMSEISPRRKDELP
jgi:hypothetical protein